MRSGFIVAGTDTGIGKTVFSAGLAAMLGATYWKPVQSGLEGGTDSEIVAQLSPAVPILQEAYRLALPASPHIAAARERVTIEPNRLIIPEHSGILVIETAGGVLVPLTRSMLQIDMMAQWALPVILCARTTLGTINHTLLSLEALRQRRIAVHGVAFIGDAEPEVEATIAAAGKVRQLGRLPFVQPLTAQTLSAVFHEAFRIENFWS